MQLICVCKVGFQFSFRYFELPAFLFEIPFSLWSFNLYILCFIFFFQMQWCGIPGTRRQRLWLILETRSTSICCAWRLLPLRNLSHWNLVRSGEEGRSFLLFLPVTVVGNLILRKFSREAERSVILDHILYRYFWQEVWSTYSEFNRYLSMLALNIYISENLQHCYNQVGLAWNV